jgi:hypothetical protein
MLKRHPRWFAIVVVWGTLAFGTGITLAQEVKLVVRDVQVGFVAKNVMNDRTAFRSTLPATVLSQRPAPAKPADAIPQPLGVITFEGAPNANIDVMLEYDTSAKMMARWPHTEVRSTRSLWRKLNLVKSQTPPSAAFPTTSWLNPLRSADRLTLEQDKREEKFILYDITLRSPTTVELESADTGYKARNIGAAAIHDVMVYRPTGNGKYRAAFAKELPGLGKSVPVEQPVAVAGAVPVQPARPGAVAQVLQGLAAAVTGQPATPSGPPVEGQPPTTPVVPPNTPQHDIAWSTEEQTPEELLASWEPLLAAQGLAAPEIAHVQSIIKAQAFDKDSARIVFRLDPSVIETLAPLEITPQPDKLVRVWLVILDGADPEIKNRINQMIAELGDVSYEKRMAAKAQLLKLGPTAVPILVNEKANKDAEISFRVEEILEEIQNPTDQGGGGAEAAAGDAAEAAIEL